MAVLKTEVVSVRVPPDIKAALLAAAEAERRSQASMLEVMVLDYCKSHGVKVADTHRSGQAPTRTRRS